MRRILGPSKASTIKCFLAHRESASHLGPFQKHAKVNRFWIPANKVTCEVTRGTLTKHQKLDVFDIPLICVAFGTLPKHQNIDVFWVPR